MPNKYPDSLIRFHKLLRGIDIQAYLANMNRLALPPVYDNLYRLGFSITELYDSAGATGSLLAQASEAWQEQMRSMTDSVLESSRAYERMIQSRTESILESSRFYEKVLQSHIAQVSKLAAISQISLNRINWEQIGSALRIQESYLEAIQASFLDFLDAYSTLFHSLAEQPARVVALPPFATRLPAVEFFNETTQLDTITLGVDGDTAVVQHRIQTRQEIQEETNDRLGLLLSDLDEDLTALLEGARYALRSDHPDHARHFATSLRELFTHVLHTLAPEDGIREWTSEPCHYHNNRPTRRARLLYVCRTVNDGPFTEFVEADVRAVLAFLNLFQRGTHEIAIDYTPEQLEAMLARMESNLRFLLEISITGR